MTLSFIVATIGQLLGWAIVARAVLSWFPRSGALTPALALLDTVVEPVLRPIRSRLPALGGMDLSPLVALMLIWATEAVALGLLAGH